MPQTHLLFVARELAPAGLRSGPKKMRQQCRFLWVLRTQAGASSLATGFSLAEDTLK